MFTSLRSRLWLSYALVIATALLVVAVSIFIYLLRNPYPNRQVLLRLQIAQTLLQSRAGAEFPGDAGSIQELAKDLDVRVMVFDDDQTLRFDSEQAAAGLPYPNLRPLARGLPVVRDAAGALWFYQAAPMSNGDLLVTAAPRPRALLLNVFKDELLRPMLRGGLIALLLSLLLAYLISRWLAAPLQEMISAARAFPTGPRRLLPARGPQEMQELTQAFNSMTERMQAAQDSQREFVATVSHEMKTPLTSIQGFAQAILDGTADTPEAQQQAAGVIHAEAGRLHRLVLNLLGLARLEAGTADLKMVPLEPAALLQGILEKFEPQAQQAGVNLEIQVPKGMPVLLGDGDRLAQVFTNLVDNALAFTPGGGRVVLRATSLAGAVRFEVEDSGEGIPAEAVEHIFERFYQADTQKPEGRRHGAGLGLAIVKEIVQAHGGKIGVRSRVGEGTTFEVVLPLSQVGLKGSKARNP